MPETAYRLSLAPGLEPFRGEIEFACDFLDNAYGLTRAAEAPRVLHYGAGAAAGAVSVPGVLFPGCVRTDPQGLHPNRAALVHALRAENGLRPSSAHADGAFAYDALGLIFLLLSRLEERDHPARDRYGRFPLSAALFPAEAGRLYPWADRAARDLAAALTGDPRPPHRTACTIKLTHDVDMLKGYHRVWEPLRWAAGDALKRGRPGAALARLGAAYFGGEPWRSSRRLMTLAEHRGLTNHFYFMGPSRDPMDSPYVETMTGTLARLAGEIRARGHVVGFHPGFKTCGDAAEWRRQRDGLERAVGGAVREGRQHVLRYDAASTPRIWSDAGMRLDCTPAYPEAVGFRTGSCRPHRTYDLVARQALPLVQLSTAAMEFGLFGGKYADLPLDRAVADTAWAAEICREFGGTLVLLFHTGQQEPRLWAWLESVLDAAGARSRAKASA